MHRICPNRTVVILFFLIHYNAVNITGDLIEARIIKEYVPTVTLHRQYRLRLFQPLSHVGIMASSKTHSYT